VADPAGFTRFVRSNLDDLERFAARYAVYNRLPVHCGDDILEDALALALEHWPGDLEYASDDRRRGFICKAMSYCARNLARREAKWLPHPPDYFRGGHCEDTEPNTTDSLVFTAVARAQIYELSRRLPAREQEVFQLAAIAELDTAEIAFQLGISKSAVSSALSRARLHIRQIIPPELVVELGLQLGDGGVA
jgi:RNA polymerase sigma factor (sigma-70 family)